MNARLSRRSPLLRTTGNHRFAQPTQVGFVPIAAVSTAKILNLELRLN
ncbi:hypothetical protein H6G89_11740 [Oscillatoria sp. FACHB-1407]|nr:hypothetical protein [Oscillatoria sp. FACHB-1407]MBD2461724.1 hypothetical protein [Oscillatoria sp. FACHB-1407]